MINTLEVYWWLSWWQVRSSILKFNLGYLAYLFFTWAVKVIWARLFVCFKTCLVVTVQRRILPSLPGDEELSRWSYHWFILPALSVWLMALHTQANPSSNYSVFDSLEFINEPKQYQEDWITFTKHFNWDICMFRFPLFFFWADFHLSQPSHGFVTP